MSLSDSAGRRSIDSASLQTERHLHGCLETGRGELTSRQRSKIAKHTPIYMMVSYNSETDFLPR